MTLLDQLKVIGVLGPIIGLLMLGFVVTLRSGVVSISSGQGMRQAAANLSQAVLLVVGCLLGLVVIQQWIGFRLDLM